jgi:hypothetical protein
VSAVVGIFRWAIMYTVRLTVIEREAAAVVVVVVVVVGL